MIYSDYRSPSSDAPRRLAPAPGRTFLDRSAAACLCTKARSIFDSSHEGLAPVIRAQLLQAHRAPLRRIAVQRHGHLDLSAPMPQALLTDAAGRQDDEPPAGVAMHAHRRRDRKIARVSLADRPGLMTERSLLARHRDRGRGHDLARLEIHRRG